MQQREQIHLITKMPTAIGKLQAALGQFPESKFIGCENLRKILAASLYAVEMSREHPGFPAKDRTNAEQVLLHFGEFCATKFRKLDAEAFRFFADFLTSKQQSPELDRKRAAIAALAIRGPVHIDDLRARLKLKRDQHDEARQLYRIAGELGVRLYGEIGRPQKSDTKRRKSRR